MECRVLGPPEHLIRYFRRPPTLHLIRFPCRGRLFSIACLACLIDIRSSPLAILRRSTSGKSSSLKLHNIAQALPHGQWKCHSFIVRSVSWVPGHTRLWNANNCAKRRQFQTRLSFRSLFSGSRDDPSRSRRELDRRSLVSGAGLHFFRPSVPNVAYANIYSTRAHGATEIAHPEL